MSTDFSVEREPLTEDAFPPAIQKHLSGDASEKMRHQAAAGTVPAPPADTLKMLYQLTLQGDDDLRETISETVEGMPGNVVAGMAGKLDHPGVLDWLADHRGDEPDLVEEMLRNDAADDLTFARLARHADPEICDIVATNEVRILRTPAIIEALYQNPSAPSSMVHRLLELARRNDVSLEGLPGVQRALKADANLFGDDQADERAEQEAVDEEAFDDMLKREAEVAREEEQELEKLDDDDLTRSQREKLREEIQEEQEEQSDRRGLNPAKLQQMSVPQKIRLATCGSRSAIKKLVNDPNRLVHMAAIESPRIKVPDVVRLAGQKSTPDDVLSYIANKRDWTQNYQVADQ